MLSFRYFHSATTFLFGVGIHMKKKKGKQSCDGRCLSWQVVLTCLIKKQWTTTTEQKNETQVMIELCWAQPEPFTPFIF
jgi:hypothetical protein